MPDYGRGATFTVARVEPPHVLVYHSERGRIRLTWAITLTEEGSDPGATRVRLRLRLAGVQRIWLATTGGELIDLVTIAGMATGLAERLRTVRGAQDHTQNRPCGGLPRVRHRLIPWPVLPSVVRPAT